MMIPSIAPWLTVPVGSVAVEFYRNAFGAEEVFRMDDPGGGCVARLSISGAEFWVSGGPTASEVLPVAPSDPPIRMILTVPNPDVLFAQAISAGATVQYPVQEAHGWRLGRIADPFGHHWEIGHPLTV